VVYAEDLQSSDSSKPLSSHQYNLVVGTHIQ